MTFDPVAMCRILNEEHVDYVVVGGFASVILGSPLPTEDIDVVPDDGVENLERLARALQRMNAKIRTEAAPVETRLDAGFLANMPSILNLVTDHGILDLTFQPSGPLKNYEAWNSAASSEEIADHLIVRVASIDDIIASKRAADRAKDHRVLPYLESLRDVLRSDT